MRIIFFGSSEYCLPVLKELNSNFSLSAIITKPNSTVAKFGCTTNIPVFTPKTKEDLLKLNADLTGFRVDLGIVADYGLIIPKEIFEIPKLKTLNIHFSRLPQYRGASPVQYAILFGEKNAWITIIEMAEKMDTGRIIWQKKINLTGNETTMLLYKRLFNIISQELPKVIKVYAENKLTPHKQQESQASYTKLLTRDDGYVPWEILRITIKGMDSWFDARNDISRKFRCHLGMTSGLLSDVLKTSNNPPLTIERAARAFDPWPGVWTELKIAQSTQPAQVGNKPITQLRTEKRLKILKAHLEPVASPSLLHEQPLQRSLEQTKTKLIIDFVQLEGKKAVSWKQFLEGYPEINVQTN